MKVMYVTVGAPGSGKTHLVDNSALKELDNIHSDRVRDLVEGFTTKAVNETGETFKTHDTRFEKKTWSIIWDLIEQRMQEGKTFCFDSTFLSKKSFSTLKKLREKYGYRVYVLDFTETPIGTLVRNNKSEERKENHAVVPDNVVIDMHERAMNTYFPSWVNVIDCSDKEEAKAEIENSLMWLHSDVDEYNQVKIIGDIHGSASVLEENVLNDVDPSTLYIFLGDYLDRGTENARTFKLLYEHLNDSNFVFLRGNHDKHLERFVQGRDVPNKGTKEETIPALLEAGATKKDIKRFTKKLQDVYMFDYRGQTYVCTHAGLTEKDSMNLTDDEEEKDQTLPKLAKGDALSVRSLTETKGETKPPARFNEGTLLSAMENPAAFMQGEEKNLVKTLGETGGLGTVATRADIIEKLFNTFLIEKKGKEIFITSKGKQLLELVPSDLKSPALTAEWEQKLSGIAKGKLKSSAFIKEMKEYTKQTIKEIKSSDQKFKHDNITGTHCPECGKLMLKVNGKRGTMLVCQDRECGHRKTIAKQTNARCPVCHKRMELRGHGEGQTVACVCGHREKLSVFEKRRANDKNSKASKRDVHTYMKKQNKDEPINNALAEQLKKLKLDQ